jgi:hypothetical protein
MIPGLKADSPVRMLSALVYRMSACFAGQRHLAKSKIETAERISSWRFLKEICKFS